MNKQTKDKLFELARKRGYNLNLFSNYLNYREKYGDKMETSIEEMLLIIPNLDSSIENLNDYALTIGYGNMREIPDTAWFLHYCANRDVSEYEYFRNILTKDKKDKENHILLEREDKKSSIKLYAKNDETGSVDFTIVAKGELINNSIVLQVDEEDILYSACQYLYEGTHGATMTSLSNLNSFKIEESDKGFNLVATGKEVSAGEIEIPFGNIDNFSYWQDIIFFFVELKLLIEADRYYRGVQTEKFYEGIYKKRKRARKK